MPFHTFNKTIFMTFIANLKHIKCLYIANQLISFNGSQVAARDISQMQKRFGCLEDETF